MKYSGHRKLLCEFFKSNAFISSDTRGKLMHIPHSENWFQYVRREYATAIYVPCLIALHNSINKKKIEKTEPLKGNLTMIQ